MKYIRYTFVDARTNTPVSEAPAKNGPVHPEGVVPTFAIESTYSTGVPAFYGIAEDDFEPAAWMYEMPEEQFYSDFRLELKERARSKRKQVEQGGVSLGDSRIDTTIESQNRVANLVTTLNLDPEMLGIDFEASPGVWVEIDRDTAFAMGTVVARHVQGCFSWCKSIHAKIDAMDDFDKALEVVTEINAFGQAAQEVTPDEVVTPEEVAE